jgi:hypothetical protein
MRYFLRAKSFSSKPLKVEASSKEHAEILMGLLDGVGYYDFSIEEQKENE